MDLEGNTLMEIDSLMTCKMYIGVKFETNVN